MMIDRSMLVGVMVLSALLAWPAGGVVWSEPATAPAGSLAAGQTDKLPHLSVDVKGRRVRVECESLRVEAPLEFFCVMNGTSEHESVLRSQVKASDLHLALLMIGLKPGAPVRFDEASGQWLPPHGPPLKISCQFDQPDGRRVTMPANEMMRSIKTRRPMPPMTWIFAGSRVMEDGNYAADVTGYLVSIVNFELTVIDVPELASSANETLEWETNDDLAPPHGTKVWMIIEPAADGAEPKSPPSTAPSTAPIDPQAAERQREIDVLRQRWLDAMRPNGQVLRDAAHAHYEIIAQLRRKQKALYDEAERIQKLILELQDQYDALTTPEPRREQE